MKGGGKEGEGEETAVKTEVVSSFDSRQALRRTRLSRRRKEAAETTVHFFSPTEREASEHSFRLAQLSAPHGGEQEYGRRGNCRTLRGGCREARHRKIGGRAGARCLYDLVQPRGVVRATLCRTVSLTVWSQSRGGAKSKRWEKRSGVDSSPEERAENALAQPELGLEFLRLRIERIFSDSSPPHRRKEEENTPCDPQSSPTSPSPL